jgi:hypothetical protein
MNWQVRFAETKYVGILLEKTISRCGIDAGGLGGSR